MHPRDQWAYGDDTPLETLPALMNAAGCGPECRVDISMDPRTMDGWIVRHGPHRQTFNLRVEFGDEHRLFGEVREWMTKHHFAPLLVPHRVTDKPPWRGR